MNADNTSSITDLVTHYRRGYTLPAPFYTRQDLYGVDLDVFFHKHWILAGVTADIPEPGDVRKLDIGTTSILLLRDDDMQVRAFHNVCRHRGARLVGEDKTSVGRLVCPYHQWSYDLNGDLVHAAHMGKEMDRACHGLKPVNLRVIGGLVFLCIDENAPSDIDDISRILGERLEPYDLGNAHVALEKTIVEPGNWKLSVDNNRECYHCEGSHPELLNTFVGMDIGFDPDEVGEEEKDEYTRHCEIASSQVAVWEGQGFPSRKVEHYEGFATLFRTERFMIAGAGESHTIDGSAACRKLLGRLTDPRFGDMHLHTHNSWSHFFADHAVISWIIPLAPDRTELRTIWLVNKDAREGVDYDFDRLTEVWLATNQQDADLVTIAQQGVASTGYQPGPLSAFCETAVDRNIAWYIERLQKHGFGA
ncbi:aromatic ring-hydroxylating oxygenase subunit alpha [Rhizobium miluonense]|uniref:Rieske 2Fe-2S family protein n=1 Tax=Rhizobium miluonense TaxID=411945 RepID=A0A1C3V872_9HYPH|nr:aromatic ring-hydroxylating dioxygenase subunit alpha [Rhizobium miluonense]SCB23871.1 Rieske 2Fe-2S family protein [Rhizobium miluonense]